MGTPTTQVSQVIDMCKERSDIYRLLASLIDREVSNDTVDGVRALANVQAAPGATDDERLAVRGFTGMARAVESFSESISDKLACDYAVIFLASCKYKDHCAVPYESIYESEAGVLMQEQRDQVRAEFRAEGVMPSSNASSGEDYLPFELEFMAHLSDKLATALEEGDDAKAADVSAHMNRFLNSHILNWVEKCMDDVDRVATTPFYHSLADAVRGFTRCEKQDVADLARACALEPAA